MEQLVIHTASKPSHILIGEKLSNLKNYIPPKSKVIVITDENILKHYRDKIEEYPVITIQQGEQNKNLATIDYIMGRLIELEADRSSFIVGVGGGIVCDITGFAASIYMRGLRFGFVSTTLLSMVDASVGGKNGVNYQGYKNMVGVFNQPEFVICDIDMLKTLDRREYIGGFAEVIKHGAIRDAALFEFLENNFQQALNYELDAVMRCVKDSVRIKAAVVENDEREKGERRVLNFGHTFGHAIEKLTGIPHGEAVAIGMTIAANVSCQLNLISSDDSLRIKKLIQNFQLPAELQIDPEVLVDAMKKDKKREGEEVHLVLLESIGKAIIKTLSYKQLTDLIYDLR